MFQFLRFNAKLEQTWKSYLFSICLFSFALVGFSYVADLSIAIVPSSAKTDRQDVDSSVFLNSVISYLTTTNWQAFVPELHLNILSRHVSFLLMSFLAPAISVSVSVALVRSFVTHQCKTIGCFWEDLTRSLIWVVFPLSFLGALGLIFLGVPQFIVHPDVFFTKQIMQIFARWYPIASHTAISLIGSNGGGYFAVGLAHPWANPTPISNLFEVLLILILPSSLMLMFGRVVKQLQHALTLWFTSAFAILIGLFLCLFGERSLNHLISVDGFFVPAGLEGKELRFGIFGSCLMNTVSTATSCGAVNSAISSFSPLAVLTFATNLLVGEVFFGGAGTGVSAILGYCFVAVFVGSLLIGKRPQYLGKNIESRELLIISLMLTCASVLILVTTSVAFSTDAVRNAIRNPSPRGFTEIIYAIASTSLNNGSAMSGFQSTFPFFNYLTSITMLLGRFLSLGLTLALAGSLAAKRPCQRVERTIKIDGFSFSALFAAVVLFFGALSFFPTLSLGLVRELLLLRTDRFAAE